MQGQSIPRDQQTDAKFIAHWKEHHVVHPDADAMSTGAIAEVLEMVPDDMPDLQQALCRLT